MNVAGGFDPQDVLSQITSATEGLLSSAARLNDAEMREPSLLPGWSRGHVLTHVARNADGGRRLLTWAHTGIEQAEYPSMRARAEEIEAGSGRAAAAIVADVRRSAARFAIEYAMMPAEAWQRVVSWTGGLERAAARAADSRLTEVLVHHVDLRAGYRPADWPPGFVSDMLRRVVGSFSLRDNVTAMRCLAADTDTWYQVKESENAQVIRGEQASLLAWLMGRSDGADLWPQDGTPLPALPPLY